MQPKYAHEPRPGLGPYIDVIIGERFGKWPWELDEVPAVTYLALMNLLSLESELAAYVAKLPTDQEIIFDDEDD